MCDESAREPATWMIIEETEDGAAAGEVARLLREAGIEVRVRTEAAGEQHRVEVRMEELDRALEVLEAYDGVE